MNDKTREEFEAWYLAEVTESYGNSVMAQAQKNLDWVREDGSFADPMLRLASLAWAASRESLVIDLSDLSNCFSPNDCGDWAMWLDDVRVLVQQAGLKVKQ